MGIPLGVIGTVAAANVNQGDPHWNNVILLANWTNASSVNDIALDASGNVTTPVTAISGPTMESSAPVSAEHGNYYDSLGTNRSINFFLSNESLWGFTGPFTIEFWWWGISGGVSTTGGILSKRVSNSDETFSFTFNPGNMNFFLHAGGTHYTLDTGLSRNSFYGKWNHLAATRDSDGYVRFYHDGVMIVKSATPFSGTVDISTAPFYIGRWQSGSSGGFSGKMDDIRVTKDVARYTTDTSFPVPTEPFKSE